MSGASEQFLLERLREAARTFAETASQEQLESFLGPEKVGAIRNDERREMSLVSKLESGDQATLDFIMRLPAEAAMDLLKSMNWERARELCNLNTAFGEWCKRINLMEKLRLISVDRQTERGKRLSALFCRTEVISVELVNPRYVASIFLNDREGVGGFQINGPDVGYPFPAARDEMNTSLPFPTNPKSTWVGIFKGEYQRWYYLEYVPPGSEVVDTFTRLDGGLAFVTKEAREAYAIFFFRLLQGGWDVKKMASYSKRGRAPPPSLLNVDCVHCGSALDKIYTCAKCKKPKYCGKECQVSNWHTHHRKECSK